jgi:hypothetical protein
VTYRPHPIAQAAAAQPEPALSPTLAALRDLIASTPGRPGAELAASRALLAAHARELAERIRNSEALRNFTDDHMSDMNEAAAELDRYADNLDAQAAGGAS